MREVTQDGHHQQRAFTHHQAHGSETPGRDRYAAMHEFARSVTRAEFENTRRVLGLAPGAPGRLLRSPLAQQAMLSMAAALDLLKAWS